MGRHTHRKLDGTRGPTRALGDKTWHVVVMLKHKVSWGRGNRDLIGRGTN